MFRQNRQKRAKMTEQNRANIGAEIVMFRQNRQKRPKMTEQTTMGIGGSILFQNIFIINQGGSDDEEDSE